MSSSPAQASIVAEPAPQVDAFRPGTNPPVPGRGGRRGGVPEKRQPLFSRLRSLRRARLANKTETRGSAFMRLLFLVLVVIPTTTAIIYYGLLATNRYVAEARFVVRSAGKSGGAGGLGMLLQMSGAVRSNDDTYAVQEYMASRDAVASLEQKLPLREIFNRPEGDFYARYPNFIYGKSFEDLHKYFKTMVSVSYNSSMGIGRLIVQAFRPDDAQLVAEELLRSSEQLVNRMNERRSNDLIKTASAEVARAQQALVSVQLQITDFRNRELMLDPSRSSIILIELIGRLSAELAQARTQLAEATASSPSGPQVETARRRVRALEDQIASERDRVSNSSDGLAEKIASYDRMNLQREFAIRQLATTFAALEAARMEARRQQLYLERVVEPNRADLATMPTSWTNISSTFLGGLLTFLMIWLVVTGAREHSVKPQ